MNEFDNNSRRNLEGLVRSNGLTQEEGFRRDRASSTQLIRETPTIQQGAQYQARLQYEAQREQQRQQEILRNAELAKFSPNTPEPPRSLSQKLNTLGGTRSGGRFGAGLRNFAGNLRNMRGFEQAYNDRAQAEYDAKLSAEQDRRAAFTNKVDTQLEAKAITDANNAEAAAKKKRGPQLMDNDLYFNILSGRQ